MKQKLESRSGSVFQINISDGGVPKRAVRSAELTTFGLVGDSQAHQDIHGGPNRAVCLYSLEQILNLQSEGNPIFPGSIGENLTLVGIDWGQIVPGKKLRLGENVLLEIANYTSPCNTIVDSFSQGRYDRVSEKSNPGWSRVYARVLKTGTIHIGDAVNIE